MEMMNQAEQTIKVLSTALERIADNVMITDLRGIIEYVNPAFEKTTGYSRQEVIGQTPKILCSGQHDALYYHTLWETILSGQVFRATTINKKKNRDVFYADQTISPVRDEQGGIVCFVSVWKDITERIVNEERLKHEKIKLEQVLNIEAGLHSILDFNKLIDFVVEKVCQVLEVEKCSVMFIDHELGELCVKGYRGIEESTVSGERLKIGDNISKLVGLYHKVDVDAEFSHKNSIKIDGSLYQGQRFLSVPIELKDRAHGIINVSHKKNKESDVFTDLDLRIIFMIVRQVRIAVENAELYRELKYLTTIDALTGIYNYRHLNQALDQEIIRSQRYKRNLSFIMMDVDQFKVYNDTFGHVEGDKLLQEIAKTIKQNVRATDVVCRYAGDEFAVILPETDLTQAQIVVDKIKKKVSAVSLKQPITISLGAAQYVSGTNRHDLIQRADSHLYEAKKLRKN